MMYTTIAGDSWDMIAHKTLGNALYVDLLIKSNLKYRDVVIFSAGVKLTVPEESAKKKEAANSLPPWRR